MRDTEKTDALEARRILITGASSGIGLAIARLFAEAGGRLALQHRRPAEQLPALPAVNGAPHWLAAELTETNTIRQLLDEAVARLGGLDILVNNAGAASYYGDFLQMPVAAWQQSLDLNGTVPFLLSQAAWPHLIDSGNGRIINISTAALGYAGSGRAIAYLAGKAVMEACAQTLAKEGAKHNILVNTIRCGVIDTDMHARVPGYDEATYQKRVAEIPLGRAGQADEVAALALHLAGAEGGFITGQTITIAGGD